MIESAYKEASSLGLALWTTDQAGPFQTRPYAGQRWNPDGKPHCQSAEYIRNGIAKILTLFSPADGQVQVKGVRQCTNEILHGWLQGALSEWLAPLPWPEVVDAQANRKQWTRWTDGLSKPPPLPADLPALRALLVLDNLAGHKSPAFVQWLFSQGVMPLYTPLGGSWLNMTESIQRILKRRALDGQSPETPEEIITLFEATARGWNRCPTPFVWGGKRAARRERSRQRRYAVGGSGACTHRPVRRRQTKTQKWLQTNQMTH